MRKHFCLIVLVGVFVSGVSAFAADSAKFFCHSESGLFGIEDLFVKVSADGEKLAVFHEMDGTKYSASGKRDRSYRPRQNNVVRFSGNYENLISESGAVNPMMPAAMPVE